MAKMLSVPDVHPRLIAYLDGRYFGKPRGVFDYGVLGLPTGIGIEVKQIDILDPVFWWAACEMVPDHVIERARNQPPIRQSELLGAPERVAYEGGIGDYVEEYLAQFRF